MRWGGVVVAVLFLTGCQPSFQFNTSEMTPDQMLDRATLVFVGVIESQTFVSWPFLRIPGQNADYWRVLERRVTVEAIARGQVPRKVVDVYEYFPVGGVTGDWNNTQPGDRCVFLLRDEGGSYHVARDFWRSIFPVRSGKHDRFPLDESRPVWERVALLQFWVARGYRPSLPARPHLDPSQVLGSWRTIKLMRGLLRHPDPQLRLAACEALLSKTAQDECYEGLEPAKRTEFGTYYNAVVPAKEWERSRRWLREFARNDWEWGLGDWRHFGTPDTLDRLKLFTTVNDRKLREEFCEKFQRMFPDDHDNGCPADRPPPATIVTADGDVPLAGAWPSQ